MGLNIFKMEHNVKMDLIFKSKIKCPDCGFEKEETMPTDSCQFFYKCTKCGVTLKSKEGDCCVFCSYSDKKCPSKQCEC